MRTTLLSAVAICVVCANVEAREDVPLKWKLQRWEYVVVVQTGDQIGDEQTRHRTERIVEVVRGKKEEVPEFDWWRHKDHVQGRFYLMCFHKAPPGTSAWESFNLTKVDDAFTILKFHTEDNAPVYGTKAEYEDMTLDELRTLLKAIPFEPNMEKTEYYKNGMIKSSKAPEATR